MGKFKKGQRKKRPGPAAGLPCEVEGCDVTECSGWFAKGRCCSKQACKMLMGITGVKGAANGIRKPRKALADVTNTPSTASRLSDKHARMWQESARPQIQEVDTMADQPPHADRAWVCWATLMQERMEFYEDVLAAHYGIDVNDCAALNSMRDALARKFSWTWPEQPSWVVQPRCEPRAAC